MLASANLLSPCETMTTVRALFAAIGFTSALSGFEIKAPVTEYTGSEARLDYSDYAYLDRVTDIWRRAR